MEKDEMGPERSGMRAGAPALRSAALKQGRYEKDGAARGRVRLWAGAER